MKETIWPFATAIVALLLPVYHTTFLWGVHCTNLLTPLTRSQKEKGSCRLTCLGREIEESRKGIATTGQ